MLENIVISAIFGLIFGLIGAWLIKTAKKGYVERSIAELDARLFAIEQKTEFWIGNTKATHAREKRAENKEAEAEFMAQALAIYKGEGDIKDKLVKIYALNPELALKFGKKLLMGKL